MTGPLLASAATSPEWTYLVGDLRSGLIAGELPLYNVRMSKTLGESGTVNASLLVSGAVRGDLYQLTTPARTALYALRGDRVWWGGIIWTRRYNSQSGMLDVGGADWWSYFNHRKVLPVLNPGDEVSTRVTEFAGDQNQIARDLVAQAQSHTGGDIGVQLDGSLSGVERSRTYYGYELNSVGDALTALQNVEGGPDMMFDCAPTLDGQGRPVRLLRIGAPTLGQLGTAHVLEYGGNVAGYSWQSDGARMATRWFAVGAGMDYSQLTAWAQNESRHADGWPLLEGESNYSTVESLSTLQGHAEADLWAARLPVALASMDMVPGKSPGVGEISPGDDARVVIDDDFFRAGLDTRMRVVSITVSPGEVEKATLTMGALTEDVA